MRDGCDEFTDTDRMYLRLAIEYARLNPDKSRNKAIGAVLVCPCGYVLLGSRQTYHNVGGYKDETVHAEDAAIRHAGTFARGGTLYVTLEPCVERLSHRDWCPKSPCCRIIAEAGISRIVIGAKDRWVGHGGGEFLRAAGIVVDLAPVDLEVECLKMIAEPSLSGDQKTAMTEALAGRETDTHG